MKYLLMIWSNPQTWGHPIFLRTPEAAAMTDEGRAAMLRDFEELMTEISESGELVTAQALADPLTARSVRVREGESLVTDGPFIESKEHLGGFYLIQADDLDAALSWASKTTAIIGMPIEVRVLADSRGA